MTKLTQDQKTEIQGRMSAKQGDLAREYGVDQTTISRIQREGLPKKVRRGPERRSEQEIREFIEAEPRNPLTGCWEWSGALSEGYGVLGRDGRPGRAHRISYEVFKGPIGELSVCHTCDNRKCVNPEHLFLGTQKDNLEDMSRKGRHNGGKLKAEDVARIREMAGSMPQVELARKFGVTPNHLNNIIHGRAWNPDYKRPKKGDLDMRATLSDTDVRLIRELAGGHTTVDLARMFDVSKGTIAAIRQGRSWRRLI